MQQRRMGKLPDAVICGLWKVMSETEYIPIPLVRAPIPTSLDMYVYVYIYIYLLVL